MVYKLMNIDHNKALKKGTGVMNRAEFRQELTKIMPGYKWTVHKPTIPREFLIATGVQSSGFNRTSTLQVTRTERDGKISYEVKSSGYGTKSPWEHSNADGTLARALRGLQQHYERNAAKYGSLAASLRSARAAS